MLAAQLSRSDAFSFIGNLIKGATAVTLHVWTKIFSTFTQPQRISATRVSTYTAKFVEVVVCWQCNDSILFALKRAATLTN